MSKWYWEKLELMTQAENLLICKGNNKKGDILS